MKPEEVANRLYNCKFRQAYYKAKKLNLPKKALKKFKKAKEDFGDCGWGGRKISDKALKLLLTLDIENFRKYVPPIV